MASLKHIHKGTEARRRGVIIDVSRHRDRRYLAQLLARLRSDETYENRRHIVRALGNIGDQSAIEPRKEILQQERGDILGDAAAALAKLGASDALPRLTVLAASKRPWIAQQAKWALSRLRQSARQRSQRRPPGR